MNGEHAIQQSTATTSTIDTDTAEHLWEVIR